LPPWRRLTSRKNLGKGGELCMKRKGRSRCILPKAFFAEPLASAGVRRAMPKRRVRHHGPYLGAVSPALRACDPGHEVCSKAQFQSQPQLSIVETRPLCFYRAHPSTKAKSLSRIFKIIGLTPIHLQVHIELVHYAEWRLSPPSAQSHSQSGWFSSAHPWLVLSAR
jgi:hypothetical protein